MSEILKADFRNARVGDRVKCMYRGDGEIQKVTDGDSQPEFKVKVSFDNLTGYIWYSVTGYDGNAPDGKGAINTLFYHFEGQFPTIESCKRPLPNIEVDEKVLVWGEYSKEWLPRHFRHFRQLDNYMGVFECGATSWSTDTNDSKHFKHWKLATDETKHFKHWKLATDETINSGNLDEIEGENE